MADPGVDLTKLTDAQLGALKMVGGDLTKLPDAALLDIKTTLSGATPSTAEKVASGVNSVINTVGTGIAKGFAGIGGAAGDIRNLGGDVADWMGKKIGDPGFGEAYRKVAAPMGPVGPTSTALNKATFSALPEVNADDNPALRLKPPMLNGGEIRLGSAIDAGIQAIPSMMMLGASPSALSPTAKAATTVIPALTGGAASDLAGQATKGTPYEIPARVVGGGLGYLAGGKMVTPFRANLSPEEARTVALAKQNNISMTAGTETANPTLQWVENRLSGTLGSSGRMSSAADKQATDVNRMALKEVGVDGERVGPEAMKDVHQQVSGNFEAAKNASGPVKLGTEFFKDLEGTVGKYLENTPPSGVAPVVENRARDFVNVAKSGVPELSGEQYQAFRKGLNDAAQSLSPGSGEAQALKGMRTALDNAMEASLPAEQAAAWQEVRRNWANYKILSKATSGGTVASRSAGDLSPSALTTALRSAQGADRFAETTGGLNDVARVGGYLAGATPKAGAPFSPQNLLSNAGSVATLGVPANLAARTMTGSQGFGWLRDYLANQAMVGGPTSLPFSLAPGIAVSAPQYPRLERRK